MKISYEWLQTFFPSVRAGEEGALPTPDELAETLVFHAYEVEGIEDVNGTSVLDVDVLPNRAADSLSHRGIAREASTLLDIPMKRDPLREDIELVPTTDSVAVSLDPKASCSYYAAAHITGVKVGKSPLWLKQRLEAIGQKSINNVVDATNYVMFELGRPTHVFDAQKFAGENPHIGTRLAKRGEKISLLGGDEVELSDTMTLIIDANSDVPIAIGGIKGGAHAEVDSNTVDIIIETANFHPKQTRLTAQALKLRTDASARFENHIADKLAQFGVVAVAELIVELAGGELKGYAAAGELNTEQSVVEVTADEASRLLGVAIDEATIESILERLQFVFEKEGGVFKVTAPFERRDINIRQDVIEEIGRVYGYNKIPSQQLTVPESEPKVNKKFAYAEKIRKTLSGMGIAEVYLYSLRDSGDIALLNSLASDKDHLRSNLAAGITESLDKGEKQMPLLGLYDAVRIFEIGNVFTNEGEYTHVCIGVRIAGTKKREERTQQVLGEIRNALMEELGESLPEATNEVLEFNLDELTESLPELDAYDEASLVCTGTAYVAASQYPFVLRDIAVWVPGGTGASEVKEIVTKHAGELLKRNDLFDEFGKDGRVSYAFHLVFQSNEETLTDQKVGVIMTAIEAEIEDKKDWEIR